MKRELTNILWDVRGSVANEKKNCSQTLKTTDLNQLLHRQRSTTFQQRKRATSRWKPPTKWFYNSATGSDKISLKAQNDSLENEDWTLKWFCWFVSPSINTVFLFLNEIFERVTMEMTAVQARVQLMQITHYKSSK